MAHVKSSYLESFAKDHLKGTTKTIMSTSQSSGGKTKVYGAAIGKAGDALNKSYAGKKKQTTGGTSLSGGSSSFTRQLSSSSGHQNLQRSRSNALMRQTSSSSSSQTKSKDKKIGGTRV